MILTNWGYLLPDLESLSSLMTVAEFNEMTANKYSGDTRLSAALASASQAIRDYCGWHLGPSAKCVLDTTFYDRRVTKVTGGVLIQLPARYVSTVTEILIGGETITEFILQPNGILLVNSHGCFSPYTTVKITYNAGLPASLVSNLQYVVMNRVTKGLNQSNGIQSETAGGVSISYSSAYMNEGNMGLTSTERDALSPYKVMGVF